MANKSEIPNGWAMPDDLSKKICKVLNNKRITAEDELADALEEMARDIALIEPDPEDWGWWVKYFLKRLESEAERRGKITEFGETFGSLGQALDRFSYG